MLEIFRYSDVNRKWVQLQVGMADSKSSEHDRRRVLQGIGAGLGFMMVPGIAKADQPEPNSFCTTTTLADGEDELCLHCGNRDVGALSTVELKLTIDPTPNGSIGTLSATDSESKKNCPLGSYERAQDIDSGYESIYIDNPEQYLMWELEIDDELQWSYTLEIEECA